MRAAMYLALMAVILLLTLSFILLGIDWLIIGHGLNPIISFPLAAIGCAAVVWTIDLFNQIDEEQGDEC